MIIQHNMTAMFTNLQLGITSKKNEKYGEKLSTGYRINRAADDAAGLTISEKMRVQIRGLSTSGRNIEEGKLYCNVAEGALGEVHSMMGRLRELAVQAANDTNVEADRKILDEEVQQIKGAITSVFENTEYNTVKVWQAAYVPEVSGKCLDYSLYNVEDVTGSYYGGIVYMNHRYSWEDLGVTNWDASKHIFMSAENFEIDADILHNNGQNTGNDSSSTNDDYISADKSGALFTINTTKDSTVINIEKSYKWSADDKGIYIDNVMTDSSDPDVGNTTWAAMGLTPGQYVEEGTYSFNYYGMEVSFEVPNGGDTWHNFLGGINNSLIDIDWHSKHVYSVTEEVADITNYTNKILINASNKNYISAQANPYTIHADADGIWMEKDLDSPDGIPLTKADTLIRWENIENSEGYKINSWGLDTGGDGTTNENAGNDGGDKLITLSSEAAYTYFNTFLGSAFSFDFKLLSEASRQAVIDDINNSSYSNGGIISPTKISSVTSESTAFVSLGISSNLSFLTQRDELNRAFTAPDEVFATGGLSQIEDHYVLTLTGTDGGAYSLTSTASCSALHNNIYDAIKTKMTDLYNSVSDKNKLADPSDSNNILGLGSYTFTFEGVGGDTVSLKMDLSNIKYGDIITDPEDDIPGSVDFTTQISNYVNDNLGAFVSSTALSIGGDGDSYQNLSLQQKSVFEDVIVNKPVVDGFDISFKIQAGANENSFIDVTYDYLRLGGLGIKSTDVLTRESASSAISSIDEAIEKVSQQRSLFGSYTNRLEHAYAVNYSMYENTQAAESKIRDADMAKEMVDYSKNNILKQAGQAILAQANHSSEGVLSLLR